MSFFWQPIINKNGKKNKTNNTEVLFHLRGNLKQMRWGSVSMVNQIKMKCNSSLGAVHVDSYFFYVWWFLHGEFCTASGPFTWVARHRGPKTFTHRQRQERRRQLGRQLGRKKPIGGSDTYSAASFLPLVKTPMYSFTAWAKWIHGALPFQSGARYYLWVEEWQHESQRPHSHIFGGQGGEYLNDKTADVEC